MIQKTTRRKGAQVYYLEIFLSIYTVKWQYSGGQSATFDLVKVCAFDPLKKGRNSENTLSNIYSGSLHCVEAQPLTKSKVATSIHLSSQICGNSSKYLLICTLRAQLWSEAQPLTKVKGATFDPLYCTLKRNLGHLEFLLS